MFQLIDISDSILYDQQKARNSFLQVINATVSHELRNPLNAILSHAHELSVKLDEIQEMIQKFRNDEMDK